MSAITKERIELFIKDPLDNGLTRGEQMELARIALASLELERGIIRRFDLDMSGCDSFGQDCGADMVEDLDGEYVLWDEVLPYLYRYGEYNATTAPVSVPDAATAIRACIDEFPESVRDVVEECASIAENACRAAMPQGSQPVSQTYKLPVNTPCQDAPAHIWLQTAGVWPEDGELSELTWCSHNQHHDDTLYVRADLVNGNSPVTPDGWISCSERMPAQDDWILIYSKHGEYMAGQVQGEYVELSDGTLSWLGNALYWMPLPEPPQEVK
ncbi:TPA: DUF551 domain-containing protein [Escherichia coli]|nr:DUF551 domain-containing protein [Escherichia coli]